jgi:hypothetical protein
MEAMVAGSGMKTYFLILRARPVSGNPNPGAHTDFCCKFPVDFIEKKSIFGPSVMGAGDISILIFTGIRRFIMMKKVLVFFCVLLMAGMTVACQKKDEVPATVEESQEMAPAMDQAVEETTDAVEEAADTMEEAADSAMDEAKEAVEAAGDAMDEEAPAAAE